MTTHRWMPRPTRCIGVISMQNSRPLITIDPGDTVVISTVSGRAGLPTRRQFRPRRARRTAGHPCFRQAEAWRAAHPDRAGRGARPKAGQVLEVRIKGGRASQQTGATISSARCSARCRTISSILRLMHIPLDRERMSRLPWGT